MMGRDVQPPICTAWTQIPTLSLLCASVSSAVEETIIVPTHTKLRIKNLFWVKHLKQCLECSKSIWS